MAPTDLNDHLNQAIYSISAQEEIFNAPAASRYDFFIKRICRTGLAWALWDGDGWMTTTGKDGKERFLIWPDEVFARRAFDEELAKIEPQASVDSIEVNKWIGEYLPEIQTFGDRIWVFPARKLDGAVVQPEDMLKDLDTELEALKKITRKRSD